MLHVVRINALSSAQEAAKVPRDLRVASQRVRKGDFGAVRCVVRAVLGLPAAERPLARLGQVRAGGVHVLGDASPPSGEILVRREEQRRCGVSHAVWLGLAEEPHGHGHPADGLEVRLGYAGHHRDVVVANGALVRDDAENAEVAQPSKARRVLMLQTLSAGQATIGSEIYIHG